MMDEASAKVCGRGGERPYDIPVRECWRGAANRAWSGAVRVLSKIRASSHNALRAYCVISNTGVACMYCAGQDWAGLARLGWPSMSGVLAGNGRDRTCCRVFPDCPLVLQAAPGVEMTWVIADYTAVSSGELTVHKGQQVEVLDARLDVPSVDWCLVRMPPGSGAGSGAADSGPAPEGLVPLSVLKQPPQGLKTTSSATSTSPSRRLLTLTQDDAGRLLPCGTFKR